MSRLQSHKEHRSSQLIGAEISQLFARMHRSVFGSSGPVRSTVPSSWLKRAECINSIRVFCSFLQSPLRHNNNNNSGSTTKKSERRRRGRRRPRSCPSTNQKATRKGRRVVHSSERASVRSSSQSHYFSTRFAFRNDNMRSTLIAPTLKIHTRNINLSYFLLDVFARGSLRSTGSPVLIC